MHVDADATPRHATRGHSAGTGGQTGQKRDTGQDTTQDGHMPPALHSTSRSRGVLWPPARCGVSISYSRKQEQLIHVGLYAVCTRQDSNCRVISSDRFWWASRGCHSRSGGALRVRFNAFFQATHHKAACTSLFSDEPESDWQIINFFLSLSAGIYSACEDSELPAGRTSCANNKLSRDFRVDE